MLVAVAAKPESATEASDAELAGRVRGGDRAAEAELFRRLAPRVRLYGLRHLTRTLLLFITSVLPTTLRFLGAS